MLSWFQVVKGWQLGCSAAGGHICNNGSTGRQAAAFMLLALVVHPKDLPNETLARRNALNWHAMHAEL